ncbi:MAG TPA: AzlD domain-containing protein [Anaerolineae bacterium]|nr:AzlD domain-containing protein [Anaerolineae bacterium]
MNNYWLIIIGMGLVTYGIRLSAIALLGQREFPLIIQRALRFVPPAVLSAIIFPELFQHSGQFDLSLSNARLLAGVLASIVAWRSKNVLATIAAGMIALWLLQAVLAASGS